MHGMGTNSLVFRHGVTWDDDKKKVNSSWFAERCSKCNDFVWPWIELLWVFSYALNTGPVIALGKLDSQLGIITMGIGCQNDQRGGRN